MAGGGLSCPTAARRRPPPPPARPAGPTAAPVAHTSSRGDRRAGRGRVPSRTRNVHAPPPDALTPVGALSPAGATGLHPCGGGRRSGKAAALSASTAALASLRNSSTAGAAARGTPHGWYDSRSDAVLATAASSMLATAAPLSNSCFALL